MMLTENAFAVLGAMPGDNRKILNEKADEAALLGGSDSETVLNQLMQMNRRITAELGWLPASSAAAAEDFLRYTSTVSHGGHAKIPPIEGLGSALAQANALSALFEIWPTEQPETFIGLCRTMDGILSQVTAEETLQAINADRTAGGWETIPDTMTLLDPLNERLRELCAPLARAVAKLEQEQAGAALKELYSSNGIDVQGIVAEVISDAYLIRIQETANQLRDSIDKQINVVNSMSIPTIHSLRPILDCLEKWASLTMPLRMRPGQMRNEAKSMWQGIRNLIVDYVNKTAPVKKTKVFTVHVFNGTKQVTLTYNSQMDCVNNAIAMSQRLVQTFPEQTELQSLLETDQKTLQEIIQKEERMLREAEIKARCS